MRIFGLMTILFLVSAASATELKIATFNAEFLTKPRVHVRFGVPFNTSQWTDEQVVLWTPQFREQKFVEAVNKVAPVISAMNAEIIVLTEVGDENDVDQLREAIKGFGVDYPHVIVCDCKDSTTQQHVAVLSKIPLESPILILPGREGYFAEEDDEDSEDDTGLSKSLKVEFEFNGERIHLYGLHLKSERGFSEADNQRIAQASLVRRHYLPLLKQGAHVIVAGDLNDGRGQPTLKRIRGFDDVEADLKQTGHIGYFEEDEFDERWTHSYLGTRNQIDHILISDSLQRRARTVKSHVIPIDDPSISDHRPIVVTFDIR